MMKIVCIKTNSLTKNFNYRSIQNSQALHFCGCILYIKQSKNNILTNPWAVVQGLYCYYIIP